MNNKFDQYITPLCLACIKAGEKIMTFYNSTKNVNIEKKEDNSPVTCADLASNKIIVEILQKISPNIPIISEEEKLVKVGNLFWLVDPLDGTKSFIKKHDEFTVNIALIENKKPILGFVYAPALRDLYYTGNGGNSYKVKLNKNNKIDSDFLKKNKEIIKAREANKNALSVVASAAHLSEETKKYIDQLQAEDFISIGSSLKFCLLAEGKADIYPRFSPTMEWDTAAAHAVLNNSGGSVKEINGDDFLYGKPDFKNNFFIAKGKQIK